MNILQIEENIKKDLEVLSCFTATKGEGCTRLPFTNEARDAVCYLEKRMLEVGLRVWKDEAGNIFGLLPGLDENQPYIMMGSHYDSVYNGGNFDGIAGVVCALHVAEQIIKRGNPLQQGFVVAGFCDEEGTRFGTGYFGSGAMLKERETAYCYQYKDKDGISIADAMVEYGLDPEKLSLAKWKEGSIGRFIELHVEQGPVLCTKGVDIGLVDSIVGIQRLLVVVKGRSDHAGTTPMNMRKDAVEVASRVISQIPDWAREESGETVATVGYINTIPGGVNIVANAVEFTVDIRSQDKRHIENIKDKIRDSLQQITNTFEMEFEMENTLCVEPLKLDCSMFEDIENQCTYNKFTYMHLVSGAGHDALEIGRVIPSTLIFVPSCEGRSHCPEEFTEYGDLAKATVVISELIK